MKEFFKQILQDKNGKFSAKRFFGGLCILAGIVLLFIYKNALLATPCFGTGTGLLGVSVAEKKEE